MVRKRIEVLSATFCMEKLRTAKNAVPSISSAAPKEAHLGSFFRVKEEKQTRQAYTSQASFVTTPIIQTPINTASRRCRERTSVMEANT